MSAYIKHKTTGEVFPVNEHLLKRGDMVLCDIHGNEIGAEPPAEPETKPRQPRQPRTKKPAEPVAEPAQDPLDDLAGFDLGDAE